MQQVDTAKVKRWKFRRDSFTLVELLVVIAIIGILVAITLQAASAVMQAAARKRAMSEIQAITTSLESYKNDNGAYPQAVGMLTNSTVSPYYSGTTGVDGSGTAYETNCAVLYQALTGMTNFSDPPVSKTYMSFKANQLGNFSASAGAPVYIKDPWSYSYGYSTGTGSGGATPSYPYNGNGFFDLWSTAGLIAPAATNSAAWICNWQ